MHWAVLRKTPSLLKKINILRRFPNLDPQRLYSSAPQLKNTRLLFGRHPVLPFSPRTRTTWNPMKCINLCSNTSPLSPPSSGRSQIQGQGHRIPRHRGGCPPSHTCISLRSGFSEKNTCLVPHCREEPRSRCWRLSPLAGCSPQSSLFPPSAHQSADPQACVDESPIQATEAGFNVLVNDVEASLPVFRCRLSLHPHQKLLGVRVTDRLHGDTGQVLSTVLFVEPSQESRIRIEEVSSPVSIVKARPVWSKWVSVCQS